jgi:hypothetical protein
MVGGGDIAIWVASNIVLFLSRMDSLRWKKGRGIYSPSRDVAIDASGGQII